jgi:hypothetical protein
MPGSIIDDVRSMNHHANGSFLDRQSSAAMTDIGRKAAFQRRGENASVGSHATGESRLQLDHTYYPQATSRCLNKYPGMAVNPLG